MEKTVEFNKDFTTELEVKSGYFSIPGTIVSAVNSYFRGGKSGIYYIGRMGYCHDIEEVSRGFLCDPSLDVISIAAIRDEILNGQTRLKTLLEDNKAIALSYIKSPVDYYSYREGKNVVMYVHCGGDDSNNVMGIGWNGDDPYGGSKKDFLIAGVLMYALGELNRRKDSELYLSCHNYLPYEAGLGEPRDYDKLIRKTSGATLFDDDLPFN